MATYDHVPLDVDSPSEEHRRITRHGERPVLNLPTPDRGMEG